MDSQFIGSVINALPLEHMIGGPLQAMIKAQVQASKAYADFLLSSVSKTVKRRRCSSTTTKPWLMKKA